MVCVLSSLIEFHYFSLFCIAKSIVTKVNNVSWKFFLLLFFYYFCYYYCFIYFIIIVIIVLFYFIIISARTMIYYNGTQISSYRHP